MKSNKINLINFLINKDVMRSIKGGVTLSMVVSSAFEEHDYPPKDDGTPDYDAEPTIIKI